MVSTRGQVRTVTPTPTMTTATTNDTSSPSRSSSSGGGPISNAGMVSTGRSSSTAVVIRATPARADATAAPGWPAWISSLPWTAPPVAAPPGTTLLAALPASCALATVPQPTRRTSPASSASPGCGSRASRVSHHRDAKLAVWSSTSSTNHRSCTSASRGHEPKSDNRPGSDDVQADARDGQRDGSTTPATDQCCGRRHQGSRA